MLRAAQFPHQHLGLWPFGGGHQNVPDLAHRDLPPEAMYSIRLRCWGWTPRIALPREIEDGTHLTRPFRLGKPSLNLVHWLK